MGPRLNTAGEKAWTPLLTRRRTWNQFSLALIALNWVSHGHLPDPMTTSPWPGAWDGQGYTNKLKSWILGVGSLSPKTQGFYTEGIGSWRLRHSQKRSAHCPNIERYFKLWATSLHQHYLGQTKSTMSELMSLLCRSSKNLLDTLLRLLYITQIQIKLTFALLTFLFFFFKMMTHWMDLNGFKRFSVPQKHPTDTLKIGSPI